MKLNFKHRASYRRLKQIFNYFITRNYNQRYNPEIINAAGGAYSGSKHTKTAAKYMLAILTMAFIVMTITMLLK